MKTFFQLLFLFTAFFSLASGNAIAQISGKDQLEEMLQLKLDRILTIDEYLIDLKVKIDPNNSEFSDYDSNGQYLPGLEVLGRLEQGRFAPGNERIVLGGNADLLIVFDKSVPKERMNVAKDIVLRTLEAQSLKSSVKVNAVQRDINKNPVKKEEPVPKPEREPSFLEQLVREKDFLVKGLIAFWIIVATLMGVYFVLRRVLVSHSDSSAIDNSRGMGSSKLGESAKNLNSDSSREASSGKETESKTNIYSKNQATLDSMKEIAEEAKTSPAKIARILSRWVSKSEESSRQASVFLKYCDIKTVEAVCRLLHPSDLEKIIEHRIEDFDPFGVENLRVIDRMRGDFALLASEHLLKQKPDPLSFLKFLSDDDLKSVLEGEDESTIALVATQVPTHRLQQFIDGLNPEKVSSIISSLSSIQKTSIGDFDKLKDHLTSKAEQISSNLFSEKDKAVSLQLLIAGVGSPALQLSLLSKLRDESRDLYRKVRSEIFIVPDLNYLSSRCRTLLVQSVDPETLGVSTSDFSSSFDEFVDGMTPVSRSVFNDARSKKYHVDVQSKSWKKVYKALQDLVSSGLITKLEVSAAIQRSEEVLFNSEIKDGSSTNNEPELGIGSAA